MQPRDDVRKRTLADEKADAYTRHVKAVQPMLHVEVDVAGILAPLPLEHALRDGRHCRVVPPLDHLERLREGAIVLAHFWWPFHGGRVGKISNMRVRRSACGAGAAIGNKDLPPLHGYAQFLAAVGTAVSITDGPRIRWGARTAAAKAHVVVAKVGKGGIGG